jgi:hypothetical protein
MSAYHEIFLRPGRPVPSLVADISAACGAPLREADAEFIDYSATIGRAAVELELSNEYDNDFGIPFEDFDVSLTIRDFDSDKERELRTAYQIFHNLAGTGKYALLLVFDLQKLIDSYTPPNPQAPKTSER